MNQQAQSRATRQGDDFSLLDLAAVLLRYRHFILLVTITVPILVAVVTVLGPRSWTATASFMPQATTEGARSRLAGLVGQFGIDISGGEAGETPAFYAELIRSRAILSQLAEDTFEVAESSELRQAGQRRGTLADVLELDSGTDDRELKRAAAVEWLREEAVFVSTGTETGVVEVAVTTPWPRLSSEIAARIVDLVNEFNLESRQSQAAAERRFIEERLDEARAELREAENALQAFLQNNRAFRNSPELAFEYDRLERRVAVRQQVYTTLMESYEQARIGEVRNTPVVTIVERAEAPVLPDSRRLLLKIALGLVVGAMLGVFGAFARELMRRERAEDPEEFREFAVLWQQTKADIAAFWSGFGRKARS